MKLPPRFLRHNSRRKTSRKLMVAIASVVTMVAMLVLLAIQFQEAWSNYSKALGKGSTANFWIKSRLNSSALDIYDFVFAIRRLQTSCLLYNENIISLNDLIDRQKVTTGMLLHFTEGTELANSLETMESYDDGINSTIKFLAAVSGFEKAM